MFGWLRDLWRSGRVPPGYCVACRENLGPRGGGIEVAHGERVCSEACAKEHASHDAW